MTSKTPMTNQHLASLFEEMADLLELSGENAFRIRAYRSGASAIEGLSQPVGELIAQGFDLTTVDGIGSTLAEKSKVAIETGSIPALEKLRAEVPPTLRDVRRVPGLGAKKAMKLHQELGVMDLVSLRQVCLDGKVAGLKGFGDKTQQSILQNIDIVVKAAERLRLDQADRLAESLRSHFASCKEIQRLDFAGSYRRGKETVGDLDILVVSTSPEKVMDRFGEFPDVSDVLARGDTKMSVRMTGAFQVDLRVVEEACWGAALQYFTGSKEHNVHVRSIAKSLGLKISEYGVFREGDDRNPVAGLDEASLYEAIGLPWIPPELRENRFEFQKDVSSRLKDLIELSDIRGDLHMHTVYTDGVDTIEAMAQAAIKRGLEYIAITDHSKRVSVARGLDDEQVLEQWAYIDRIAPEYQDRLQLLKGIECDILEDGTLDLSDETLAQADWVTASVHFGFKQSREEITDRILGAIAHRSVHSISHPSGRLISRRPAYDYDLTAVIQAAAEHGKCLEINANPERLDLNDLQASAAVEAGVMMVINTDAHAVGHLDLMKYGIGVARRAGIVKKQVLNTKTTKQMLAWLKKHK
ncbi:MAG: DNA polymerase/3'-5' exonuclease PolX [Planctomycetota bacterium]